MPRHALTGISEDARTIAGAANRQTSPVMSERRSMYTDVHQCTPMITVRPATAADFATLYGYAPKHTFRGEVAELDGVAVGIGGIAYGFGRPLLFAKVTPALRPFKRFILTAARRLAELAMVHQAVAVADPAEPLSGKLLSKIGLHKVAESPEGDVFEWAKH
jgi:hypothetical protein